MGFSEKPLERLEEVIRHIIKDWYERVRHTYVTEEDSRNLGLEPEVKCFHEPGSHRIKFARKRELDVTYGLRALEQNGQLCIESSVNNKSARFNYEAFLERLTSHYWESRFEKPWTEPELDRISYSDLLLFEPELGKNVIRDSREDRAEVIRLRFPINERYHDLLMSHSDLLRDLVENHCLGPLRRIYAEAFREGPSD